MSSTRSIEFEIIKEPWIKYQISDNSILKVRTILQKVDRIMTEDVLAFNINAIPLIIINPDPTLKGSPSSKDYSQEEIKQSIEKYDMRYSTIYSEFNKYVLDDGTKIKIYTNVTNINKSSLYDTNGDPIYDIQISNQIEIKISNGYRSAN